MTTAPRPHKAPRPRIVIDAAQLSHLEALADGAMERMPDMADRLLTELSRARVVDTAKLPADIVAIGREVTWRDESTGREQTAVLVWPEDADIAQGRISVATPIGVALIGLSAGARFTWQTRGGEERELTVISVN